MSEMVERVKASRLRYVTSGVSGPNWYIYEGEHPIEIFTDREARDERVEHLRARAAIAALREPTEAMVKAAYQALDRYDITQPDACTVKEAHRAMIDAALSE